jgi:hypothetical protein
MLWLEEEKQQIKNSPVSDYKLRRKTLPALSDWGEGVCSRMVGITEISLAVGLC